YPDVRAHTVALFRLNDYEWILAFEADELHRIVDLMRDLRASRARRHVREEGPFFTGRRRPLAGIVAPPPCPAAVRLAWRWSGGRETRRRRHRSRSGRTRCRTRCRRRSPWRWSSRTRQPGPPAPSGRR